MQIIQDREPLSSIRQRALNDNLAGAINSYAQMEQTNKQEAATQRQQALDLMKTTQGLRSQGYDVNESQVKQFLEPEKPQSIGQKIKGFFTGEEATPQERPDLFGKRTAEYTTSQEQKKQAAELDRQSKQADINNKNAQTTDLTSQTPLKNKKMQADIDKINSDISLSPITKRKMLAEIAQSEANTMKLQSEASAGGGKQLSAADVMKVNEGNAIPTMLKDVSSIIKNNADSFGPVKGRFSSMNPYNEKSQTIESNIRASSQAFGRFMEGGVLRKEDEEKYQKMFPNLSDTPAVAANKLAIVEKLLVDKQNSSVGALKASGYNTNGVDQNLTARQAPKILGIDKAPTQAHPQTNQALEWAKANPADPRAIQIMERLSDV